MKKFKYHLFTILFAAVSFLILYAACIQPESTPVQDRFVEDSQLKTSVTFIMGKDKKGSDYYTLAEEYFLYHPKERSDVVIKSCYTISDVINFLNDSRLRNNAPWSVINLVAHGNPNTGINLYLDSEGEKATPKRMLQAVLINSLPKLNSNVVDSTTKVNVWSCGIGKNPLINLSIRKLFQPKDGDSVSVYCSPHFVIFRPDADSAAIQRLSLSYWPYYYKRGYRPSESEIVHAMKRNYPSDSINWSEAIEVTETNDLFSQEYHIPISYTKIYEAKSDRPDLYSLEQKLSWINSQQSILSQIEESGIPIDKFHWQVNKIIYTDKNGDKVPAVKAIGMATVVNVLKKIEV